MQGHLQEGTPSVPNISAPLPVEAGPWPEPLSHTRAHLVVPEQERQQHEHAAVVNDPPDIDAALGEALRVPREHGNVLGDQQGQVTSCGFPDQLWEGQGEGQMGTQ